MCRFFVEESAQTDIVVFRKEDNIVSESEAEDETP
jgi:hypothetical protein